jgi:hypothetical protein
VPILYLDNIDEHVILEGQLVVEDDLLRVDEEGGSRAKTVEGILLLGARSSGYNVRRNRFVVPRPKP